MQAQLHVENRKTLSLDISINIRPAARGEHSTSQCRQSQPPAHGDKHTEGAQENREIRREGGRGGRTDGVPDQPCDAAGAVARSQRP